MWRWLRRLLYLIIACGVLFLAAGLAASLLISGSAKDRLVSTLGQALGVPVSVESARFDFWQWVKLRPAVSLEGIAIGNLPGFRGTHLIEAKKLSAEIALGPLFRREVVVRSIEIDEPRILVETNAQGATNVEALLKRLSAQGGTFHSALLGNAGFLKLDRALSPHELLSARLSTSRYYGTNNVFFEPSSPITNDAVSGNGEEQVATESASISLISSFMS
ncbi:MAG: hypothetical protein ABSD56_13640, partial [Bryobacteraceae bacterium]